MAFVRVDTLRSIASGSITNAYQTLGAVISKNWRMCCFINNTDGDMFISFDGTTNNLFVPKNGFRLYDFSTNSPNISDSDSFVISINTQLYIKYSSAPTTGSFYVEGVYATGV